MQWLIATRSSVKLSIPSYVAKRLICVGTIVQVLLAFWSLTLPMVSLVNELKRFTGSLLQDLDARTVIEVTAVSAAVCIVPSSPNPCETTTTAAKV